MHPDAEHLIEQHYDMARYIGLRFRFPGDPGLGEGVALEALCQGAETWVARRNEGDATHWLSHFVKIRLIDEYRAQKGRLGSLRRRTRQPLSIDADPVEKIGRSDVSARPDEWADVIDVREMADVFRRDLSSRERFIIAALDEGWTMAKIGQHLGITESRVSQITKAIRGRARRMLAAA